VGQHALQPILERRWERRHSSVLPQIQLRIKRDAVVVPSTRRQDVGEFDAKQIRRPVDALYLRSLALLATRRAVEGSLPDLVLHTAVNRGADGISCVVRKDTDALADFITEIDCGRGSRSTTCTAPDNIQA
jgi:hypothetical protein